MSKNDAKHVSRMAKGSKSAKRTTQGNPAPLYRQLILPWKDQMKEAEVEKYRYVIFDKPESIKRTIGDLLFERLCVPIRKLAQPNDFLGYLPLPTPYFNHWKQLCYTIVYHRHIHQALLRVGHNFPNTRNALCSLSAALKYNLYCRGLKEDVKIFKV